MVRAFNAMPVGLLSYLLGASSVGQYSGFLILLTDPTNCFVHVTPFHRLRLIKSATDDQGKSIHRLHSSKRLGVS
mgnify:CR=1 FL=1